MILTEAADINYLLYRGLISGDEALSSKTSIRRSSSRNRNFIVSRADGAGYFIKQASTFLTEKIQTLRSEANCYWLANNDSAFKSLKNFMCTYFDYHPQYNILTIEAAESSNDLYNIILKNRILNTDMVDKMACALSAMHHIRAQQLKDTKAEKLFAKSIPWIFKIEKEKKSNLNVTTPATKELIDIVNKHTDYLNLINKNKDAWEITTLIHGDIKFPNFLSGNIKNEMYLKLIDFELCDIGDPCWDVAGVFQAYLTYWIETGNSENDLLDDLQAGIKLFWKSYFEKMSDIFTDEKLLLVKCMNYSAIRIIQTAYEFANSQQQLQPNQIKTLQMSFNILKQPEKACFDLLGIKLYE